MKLYPAAHTKSIPLQEAKSMGRIRGEKIIKITAGCCLALLIAQAFELRYSTSVVTITLLSILGTRRETFRIAGKRFCAFFAALAVALPSFYLLQYSVAAIAVYLLLFVALCQLLHIEEGLSMSTVLMLHFWSARTVALSAVLNEFTLMSIGIAMGILMNSYMPRQTAAIRADQRRIEELMRTLLGVLAQALIQPSEPIDEDQLRELDLLLQDSRKRAFAHRDNSFSRDMDYYARYMDMRREQYRILERLFLVRSRLTEVSRQSYLVANFMRSMAFSLHEYNNAEDLLRELELIRRHFQSGKLPVTRPEFENRAVLYEIVFELRQLLLLKQNFAASLTPSQIRLFWKEAPQTKWE